MKDKNPLLFWWPVVFDVVNALIRARLFTGISSTASPQFINNKLFGINIAPSADADSDSYIIERLQDLGIDQVRMNYTYSSIDGDAQRLLQRILAANIDVLLDMIPPAEEAKNIEHSKEVAQRWRNFVASVFEQYQGRVSVFEIGSTPNRGRWSGLGHRGFLKLWQIACEEAKPFDVSLAGPNVSDFEPVFNLAFLSAMKRYSRVPQIHTDNLFVERVIEPEAYDHRVLGRWLAKPLALNLIKKARVLAYIGRHFGVDKTWCTYSCWTTKRLDRKAVNPEQKQVDYLVRYCVLAAASTALSKIYWGPLICSRDGMIDCGAEGYPKIDNVSFYKEIRGKLGDFQIRPAFYALQQTVTALQDSVCAQGVNANNGIHHFVFTKDSRELHIVWCRDSQTFSLRSLYPQTILPQVEINNAVGERLAYIPEVISEQPLFLLFAPENVTLRPDPEAIKAIPTSSDVMQATENQQAVPVQSAGWRGALMLENGASLEEVSAQLSPEEMESMPVNRVLRDTRNRLWTIDDLTGGGVASNSVNATKQLVVKLNRAKGIKKFTYRFLPSKGRRHWNNASYMRRCGISTPQPVAYFERYKNSGIEENYYVCRYVEDAFSARDVFTCFNQGEDNFRGFSKEHMFAEIAGFIRKMHEQRIIHRDLSSGNLMMKINAAGTIDVYVIDIGRAKVGIKERLSGRQRFVDLMRICYKLDWNDRELFVNHYSAQLDSSITSWWRLPLFFYEAKQTVKKMVKGKYRRKSRSK
ncbi:MAG: lipopolysaccharide kinase InaA family protein [Pseudomonadales bacterium]